MYLTGCFQAIFDIVWVLLYNFYICGKRGYTMNSNASRPNFGIRLLGFLLALVLFAGTMSAIAIADIRIITTKENLTTIIRQALFERTTAVRAAIDGGKGAATARNRMNLAMVKLDEANASSDASQALVEWVYDTLMEQHGDELELTLENVEAFVEDSTLKDTIAQLGASLISDAYTGENTTELDQQTVRTLLEENADVIKEHFDIEISTETLDALTQTIVTNDYVAQIQEEGVESLLMGKTPAGSGGNADTNPGDASNAPQTPTPDAPNAGVSADRNLVELLQAFRDATSAMALLLSLGVVVLCVVLLLLIYRKWIWCAFGSIGWPLMLASVPYLLVTVPALWMKDLWNLIFSFSSSVGAAARTIMELTAPVCIGTFALGFVLAVVGLVWKAIHYTRLKTREQELSEALIAEEPEKTLTQE